MRQPTALAFREHARSLRASWLAAGPAARCLLVASFVDAVGTGLFLTGSALFFTRSLGLSTKTVGVGLSLAGVSGLIAVLPVGRLAERVTGKRMLISLYAWRAACFAAYPFAHSPGAFIGIACLVGVAEWSTGPIVQNIAATGRPGSRVSTMAWIASVRNVGFTVGALLATAAVATNRPAVFAALVFADAGTFAAAALLLMGLPRTPRACAATERALRRSWGFHDARFLAVTALNGILYLHSVLLTVGLPLWIVTRTRAPSLMVGAVVVINTAVAIALQVPLSRGSASAHDGAKRAQRAGWCLAGCCTILAFTGDMASALAVVTILCAAVVLTLGEIWQSAGAWQLSYALAPEDRQVRYLAVFQLGPTASNVVGPAILTAAVIRNGTFGWLCLAGVFLLAGAGMAVLGSTARGAWRPVSVADE